MATHPMTADPILKTEFENAPAPKRGKVRDIYDLGDSLLIVATDRISVFDVVLPTGIPDKGRVLTQISNFWFNRFEKLIANHLLATEVNDFPAPFNKFPETLSGRAVHVKKAKPLPIECIVRGHISGSGWKEYQKSGTICGIKLPAGLVESDKLEKPLFTPSTKAEQGHDENISPEQAAEILGDSKLVQQVEETAITLFSAGRDYAETKGIIIADTKFEFGVLDGKLILIDEVLTPDSSRFWPKSDYAPGRSQASYDKQFVRDYTESLGWGKTYPGPELPEEIVVKTREKYLEALKRLTT